MEALYLILLMIASIFLIVRDRRFSFERKLRTRYGIDREWWVPVIALFIAIALSFVEFSSIKVAFLEKFEIIVLIFSFGLMSTGLGKSGFFRYISYRIVEKSEGNTVRLILSMFALTSVITFFTTNDIVILLLTPIIVEICFQAEIQNAKLILLAQFIAANTLSMGLLIGSPTNIIIAEALEIGFFHYLSLMALPALIAFFTSLTLLYLTLKLAKSDIGIFEGLEYDRSYSVPEENPEPVFTSQMRDWILIFTFFVALVAVVTFMQMSLLLCAVPSILISLIYWHSSSKHSKDIRWPLKQLPYGIFFFGMTFFAFAEQFSRTGLLNDKIVPLIQSSVETPLSAIGAVFTSGIMVNTFNDLPASALVAQTLPKLELTAAAETVLTQASLVGLNIGTYLTPVGALAGLIWFNRIREQVKIEEKENPEHAENIKTPERTDLVKYGALHFAFTGLSTGIFLAVEWMLLL